MFKKIKCLTLITLFLGVSLATKAQVPPPTKAPATAVATSADTVKVMRPKPAAPAISGKWQSVSNPNLYVMFKGNKMSQTENGTTTEWGKVKFDKQCKNIGCMKMNENKKNGCFTVSGQFDITCYQVLKLTGNELIFQGFGAEDQPQAFKRVK